jgi:hypothetical protein
MIFKDSAEINMRGYCSKPVVTIVKPLDNTAEGLNLREELVYPVLELRDKNRLTQ